MIFSNAVATKLICVRTQESFDTFYMSHPVSMILTIVMTVMIHAVMKLNLMIEEVKTKIEK